MIDSVLLEWKTSRRRIIQKCIERDIGAEYVFQVVRVRDKNEQKKKK